MKKQSFACCSSNYKFNAWYVWQLPYTSYLCVVTHLVLLAETQCTDIQLSPFYHLSTLDVTHVRKDARPSAFFMQLKRHRPRNEAITYLPGWHPASCASDSHHPVLHCCTQCQFRQMLPSSSGRQTPENKQQMYKSHLAGNQQSLNRFPSTLPRDCMWAGGVI